MNFTGKKFNKLTVLSEYKKENHIYCLCKCECGNIKPIRKDAVKKTQCCGCDKINHKELQHPRLYKIWESMHARCECKTHKNYANYKDKPICEDWHRVKGEKSRFFNFYNWAISNGYEDYLTLDRIDNSKGYNPQNCRWIPAKEQARNTTRNVNITYRGKTQCMKAWCEELKLSYIALQHCIARYNLLPQEALDRYTKQRFDVKLQKWVDKPND